LEPDQERREVHSEGGRLHVRTSNDADANFVVCVEDTGLGIDAESLPKIFKAFEQGERPKWAGSVWGSRSVSRSSKRTTAASRREPRPRTGRDIHGGVPALRPRSQHQHARCRDGAAGTEDVAHLLVEDHEDTNRCLTQLLRRRGYEVEAASNVAGALVVAAKREFDVLVSDIGLPDGTGVELMQQLRQADHDIFGIALTGFGMEDDIRRSHDVGFDHHLIKPVDLNKLDALIQQMPVERGRTPAPVS
jgi:CheY-like chemotaxis protein